MDEVNRHLLVNIKVDDIDFSLFRQFPYASVNFFHLSIPSPGGFGETDTLLRAESVSLLFNVFDVMGSTIILRKIIIEGGKLSIVENENRSWNYQIWQNDSTLQNPDATFEIKNLTLNNTEFLFRDLRNNIISDGMVYSGKMVLKASEQGYSLQSEFDLLCNRFTGISTSFLDNRKVYVAMALQYDAALSEYRIDDSEIKVGRLKLNMNGSITQSNTESGKVQAINLRIHSDNAPIRDLTELVPSGYQERLHEFDLNGNGILDCSISSPGSVSKKYSPVVEIKFATRNGSVKPLNKPVALTKISVEGYYISSPKHPSGFLRLKNFSAELKGKKLNGNFEMENFNDPFLRLEAEAGADLEAWFPFFQVDWINELKGNAEFSNLRFSGRLKSKSSYQTEGLLRLTNAQVAFKNHSLPIENINAEIEFRNTSATIRKLSARAGVSDFAFEGKAENLVPFLLHDRNDLQVDLNLKCNYLDLDQVLELDTKPQAADTVFAIRLNNNLSLNILAEVSKLEFRKFKAENISGTVGFTNGRLFTESMQLDAMNGKIKLQGSIQESADDSITINYQARVNSLDISQLFYQMGDFGQQVITSSNLAGTVSADVQFHSRWSRMLRCNTQSVWAAADLSIENGALMNFAPMKALTRFVKGADFNNIRFSTLKNKIEIKNRQVIIPEMEINSSAMNLIASGTHSFDNIIDYHLQLLLSQLLGKKVRNLNTEFGQIQDDNLGRARLLIAMTGPAESPKISLDTRGMKNKIVSEVRQEKETLKNLLKNEFGKKDSVKVKPSPGTKKQELEIETGEE